MFTLGLLYVFIYVLVFISLLILSFLPLPIYYLTHHSTTSYLVILQKYTIFKNLFMLLIFVLTGLPPVGLFFVKFNILVFILYQVNLFTLFTLFILFFMNMLYYMQLFNIKNFKKNCYSEINSNIFKIWRNQSENNCSLTNYTFYNFLFFINFLLFFIFTLLFTYSDLFFIFKL